MNMETQRVVDYSNRSTDKRPRKRQRLAWDVAPAIPPPGPSKILPTIYCAQEFGPVPTYAYSSIYYKGIPRNGSPPWRPDDKDGHYVFAIGENLTSRYRILSKMGEDWGSCPMTRRLLTDYVIKLGHSLISWKVKKQQTVSRSYAEVEYRAMGYVTCEIIWLVALIKDMKIGSVCPAFPYSDSKSGLQLAANAVHHEKTKHVDVECHFIRDEINKGLLVARYISTKERPADILTKPLSSNISSKF